VTLLITGVSIAHFPHDSWFLTAGIACIPAGIAAITVGLSRYRKMDRAYLPDPKHAAANSKNGSGEDRIIMAGYSSSLE